MKNKSKAQEFRELAESDEVRKSVYNLLLGQIESEARMAKKRVFFIELPVRPDDFAEELKADGFEWDGTYISW